MKPVLKPVRSAPSAALSATALWRRTASALLLMAGAAAMPAAAATTLNCPTLDTAVQVAACPSDAELRYTFLGYCGDNARMYDGDQIVCSSFESYKQFKNTALWESADGSFSGYMDCNVDAQLIRTAPPRRMLVEQRRGITQVVCEYDNGHRLVHRTRAQCTVEEADCSGAACATRCE